MGFASLFRKRNRENETISLIGRWVLVDSDGGIDSGGCVRMEFFDDGRLYYEIDEGDKIGIMKLVYRVEGDTLVTDQPSAPRVNRTKFQFIDDRLCLEHEGSRSWFVRKTQA